MEKLKMHSPDLTEANIDKLAALFPNCVTESRDEKGQLRKSVDFDLLRQELSGAAVEGLVERYTLNWPGKSEAIVAANSPVFKTLRPCEDESVDFATTKNLYIEGDNLEVLKLLQETYLGKVKMIYIDPPYNTGNDFIYDDDFSEDVETDLLKSAQKDESGGRLVANQESNGRFHSDWLTTMYPRLKLARDLLCDAGVIFISIDDHEVHNLRKICDELFGADNFVAEIIWKKRSTPPNDRIIAAQHEYILCITKTADNPGLNLRPRTEAQICRYKNPDNHPKGPWTAGDLMANVKGGRYVASLHYPITNPRTGQTHYPSSNGNWRFNSAKIEQLIANNEIFFGDNDQGRPKLKRFLCDVKDGITWTTLWDFVPFNTVASNEMTDILGSMTMFENPKPVGLILETIRAGSDSNSIILDFFSGSATTAHAVMHLNAEDGGNRRFIMVQLPEVCGEKSEAYKAGYKNICEIGKERIRRAGQKIKEANATNAPNLDVGFRVFKLDSSNMKDVYYTPDALDQKKLDLFADAIKEDRTAEDLLFQVFLDSGLDLALPVTKEKIDGKTIFTVDQNVLIACFASDIPESLIRTLAQRKPLKAVFLDRSFAKDSTKLNVTQIFKQLSPNTEVKTI